MATTKVFSERNPPVINIRYTSKKYVKEVTARRIFGSWYIYVRDEHNPKFCNYLYSFSGPSVWGLTHVDEMGNQEVAIETFAATIWIRLVDDFHFPCLEELDAIVDLHNAKIPKRHKNKDLF